MKTISIYTKSGERAATTYYRIYQYTREIEGKYRYNKMLPDGMYRKVMPISSKSLFTKTSIFLYINIRVFFQLLQDTINRPDTLIISRRFVNRIFPIPYKWMLNSMKSRGTKIIWDFDDEIIASKEVTRKGFDYMSCLADHIIVASPVNKEMVKTLYRDKVVVLPTTDGDMYKYLSDEVVCKRLQIFENEIRLIWVGTSVTLTYVKQLCFILDKCAFLLEEKYNKRLILTVVCNLPLENLNLNHISIRNIKWERAIATNELLNSHIGLMPLEDNKVNRGKGGFKLIQYLSVGLPVIGSPVGINSSIISEDVGSKVDALESEQWGKEIEKICSNKHKWLSYSEASYKKWQIDYSYSNNLKVWEQLLS